MSGRRVAAEAGVRWLSLPVALASALCFLPLALSAVEPGFGAACSGGDSIEKALGARIPFMVNAGQLSDHSVKFYARTFGGTVYVNSDGRIIYALPKIESCGVNAAGRLVGGSIFCETLEGETIQPCPEGAGLLSARVSSFVGDDPARWKSDIPAYETVSMGEVYEGIELALRAHGNNVEKVFTVAPGSDPSRIKIRVEGVEGVVVLPGGELELMTGLGPVRFTAPVAYQEQEALNERPAIRTSVAVAYRVDGEVVGFDVGAYDKSRSLVIDPLMASTFLGGANEDVVRAIGMHSWTNEPGALGGTNIFVTGYTASSDFPVYNAMYGTYRGGNYDAFISKFEGGLSNLLASTFLGGSGDDRAYSIAVSTNDSSVVVAGYTDSSDFPVSVGAYSGAGDAFVFILNSNLNTRVAARLLGGSAEDGAYGVALGEGEASVFVSGYTLSTNFPVTGGALQEENGGAADAFVTKCSAADCSIEASSYIGGAADDVARAIAVDGNTYVFVAGSTLSDDLPESAGGYQDARQGGKDMFAARFAYDLTAAVSTYLGGNGDDEAYSLALEPGGREPFVVGYTASTNFPRKPDTDNVYAPGYTNKPMGGRDAVATWAYSGLGDIEESTYLAGAGDETAYGIFIDGKTNIHITGSTTSTNFPVTSNAYNTARNGGADVFVSSFLGNLTNLSVSSYLGGGNEDAGYAVAQTPDTNCVYVAGATESGNFPKTLQAYQQFPSPGWNGFVSKLAKNYAYGTEKWRFPIEFGYTNAVGPAFSLDGSAIYAADDHASLFALDRFGAKVWRSGLQVPVYMESAPAVGLDGTIYFCSVTNLYGIDPDDGSVVMRYGSPSPFFGSPAVGADGTVYACTHFAQLHAVNPVPPSGQLVWSNVLDTSFVVGSPVVGTNGAIYVASSSEGSDARIFQIGQDGKTNWVANLSTNTYGSPAIGSNGEAYAASGGKLFRFGADGKTNWVNLLAGVSTGTNEFSSPVIGADGTVYVGQSNSFFAVNGTTGRTNHIWVLDGRINSSAAIGELGSIYVGGSSNLYSLNPNGTTNWAFNTGGRIGMSSPLVGSDGTIYIGGGTSIFAVWGKEDLGSTPWPMYHHDQLRTRNAALGASAPAAPAGVAASINMTDRIRVTWGGVSGAYLYEVWRSLSNDVSTAVYLGSAGGLYYDDGYVPIGYNYYYWVRAKTALKTGALSSPGALGGRPTIPPAAVLATDGFPTNLYRKQAQVSWSVCSGTYVGTNAGYHVYRNTVNDTSTAVHLEHTTATNYLDTTLSPGITNFYWVSSHNLTTTSGLSVVETGGIAPVPPTNVVAVQGTTTNYLTVSWDAPPGAEVYVIYRGTSSAFSAATCIATNYPATSTNDVNQADSVPIPFRVYYYWVKATNVFGVSDESASATGFRKLHPPLSVSATDGAFSNQVGVSWQVHTTNASSYHIYRNQSNDSASAQLMAEVPYLDTTRTNYSDLEISRGLSYYYWVKAGNAYGVSDFSPSDTGGTAPSAPQNVAVSAGQFVDKIQVTWSASVGALGYEMYRNTRVDSSDAEIVGTSAGESFDDTLTVVPGVRYYYWVKATNSYGKSVFSGFDSGWRDLAPPTGVTASDGASTAHVEVAWNTSENATLYDVWRGTNSDRDAARELASDHSTNIYYDASVTPGQVYYYWVKARNAEFSGGFSGYDYGYSSLGYIDIGVSDFIFLPAAMAPDSRPDAVSFKITNHGEDDMFAPNYWVTNDFFLSANSAFGDEDDVWLGGCLSGVTLDAGGASVVKLSASERAGLAIPSNASGSYYVFVHIDHVFPSAWKDPNPDNNSASRFGGLVQIKSSAPAPFIVSDFTGDGKADIAVYDKSSGAWYVCGLDGTEVVSGEYWGGSAFSPVAGDYDGDGIVDMAVYHNSSGLWYIRRVDGSLILWGGAWGGEGFVPVWGDYNGDGIADMAVYHEATGTWYIKTVAGDLVAWGEAWGGPGFTPVPGDYDGNGSCDASVFLAGTYNWFIRGLNGTLLAYALSWGGPESGYLPVPGDYDGDGAADLAVYHQTTGYWFILSLTGEQLLWGGHWGGYGFAPVTGDFDGDGKDDLALYQESRGAWFIINLAGTIIAWDYPLGGPGLVPVRVGP